MKNKNLCGKKIRRGCMPKACPCLLPFNHRGCHTPDLTGLVFPHLRVLRRDVDVSGQPHVTWLCIDAMGRLHPRLRTRYLVNGMVIGLRGPKGSGCITPDGYRVIKQNGKPGLEHRFVMAKIIGRPLLPNETVHHGPKGRACNEPENLSIRLKGNHPGGHSIEELAKWFRSLGCRVFIPKKLRAH